MQKRMVGVLTAVLLGVLPIIPAGAGQEATPAKGQAATAQSLLQTAEKQAKKSHRRVFVIFHASWCGWCKRLDALLEKGAFRKPFAAHYVLVHLDVQENGEKVSLENPGGMKLMAEWGGEKSGLPFSVILDENGRKLGDSNRMPKQENIGYPGSKAEIAAFAKLLHETTPDMTAKELTEITTLLEANAPHEQP